MFVIINISSNLLQTLSSFLTNNSKCYVTKNGKKSSSRKYHNVTSLKKITIFEKKNLTKNNNSNNNWKSSKVSKSVTKNMSVWKFLQLQPPIPVCRGACILYFKIIVPIFCCSFFSENYLNPQVIINRMVNKHTGDYHPSPSQLTSRILPLIFLRTPKRFAFPESFLNFSLNLHISLWSQKSFKFMVLRLLANTFASQKIEFVHFY